MKILHLEDNPGDAALVRALLSDEWPDTEIRLVSSAFAFVGELQLGEFDLVLSDFSLASFNGLDALRIVKERSPDVPFLFLSGTIGEDRAIEALQSGALDYILKDRMKRLIPAIKRALREAEERRKRLLAERQIHEQSEMLNQASEAIIITDLENRVIYWNSGAGRLLGWTTGEVMGKAAGQFFTREVFAQFQTAGEVTDAKGEWRGEMQLHDRAGGPLTAETRQTLIRDEKGRPKARLSLLSDITERKRLEEQFLRAQRMENIGLLSAGIAHDLNNMLAPILMAGPLLRDCVASPQGLRLLDTLERSAERGAALVRQILAFSHGVGGGHRLLQVKHVLRDIVAVMESTFPKNIAIEDFVERDLAPIKANATQIHQVVLNLCVNARDAMPQGGKLKLRAENCVLDAAAASGIEGARAGAFVVIEVEDTGTGITPGVLAHIWEPFFTTKEADKGTGLGLSTVRGIVKNHSGFVALRTAIGAGTSFRIFLPAAETVENGSSGPVPSREFPRGNDELVLVVDDEKYIRDIVATMLAKHGYRTLVAGDGAEAMVLFGEQAKAISLVISDLHMPNLDGGLLAAALKRINPEVKIILMSGGGGSGKQTPAHLKEFAVAFLPKPFNAESLLVRVRDVLHPPGVGA